MIGVLPFFHIYGLTVILNLALWRGATVITMPGFDLEEFLRLLQGHRASVACIVPPIVMALAKHPAVDGALVTLDDHLGHSLPGHAPRSVAIAALLRPSWRCLEGQPRPASPLCLKLCATISNGAGSELAIDHSGSAVDT